MIYKVIYLFFIFGLLQDNDNIDIEESRLEQFKAKVRVFCEDCPGVLAKQEMPNPLYDRREDQDEMPMPEIDGFMDHRKSGLRYYPIESVLIDVDTKFSYDLNSNVIIDLEKGKALGSKTPICIYSTDEAKERSPAETNL